MNGRIDLSEGNRLGSAMLNLEIGIVNLLRIDVLKIRVSGFSEFPGGPSTLRAAGQIEPLAVAEAPAVVNVIEGLRDDAIEANAGQFRLQHVAQPACLPGHLEELFHERKLLEIDLPEAGLELHGPQTLGTAFELDAANRPPVLVILV